METQVYIYWVEIEGKMKGKRKVTKQSAHITVSALDYGDVCESLIKVSHYVDELVATHKPQRGTKWRFMRTVANRHTYPDGTSMDFVPMFDVNRNIIAQGDVK